jgi:uncharacterized protein with PhoU and TrkA domain
MGIIVLLFTIALGLLITRIATVALVFTGLSKDLARFQARSAFTGCGFTTTESERLVEHPVRRRIVMTLMLLGNGVVVMAISSLIPLFMQTDGGIRETVVRLGLLIAGLVAIWMLALSKWVESHLNRMIERLLRSLTGLELQDYQALLHLSEGYTITELKVDPDDWVAGKALAQLRLSDEGLQVLGVRRASNEYVGTPTGSTMVRGGDTLLVYGKPEQLAELEARRPDAEGDREHEMRAFEQIERLRQRERKDRLEAGQDGTDPTRDYHALLHLAEGYSITELKVNEGDWMVSKNLAQLRLADEGVQVLGIRRANGDYIGTPLGSNVVREGDTLLLYSRPEQVRALDERPEGASGDRAHKQRVAAAHRTAGHESARAGEPPVERAGDA